MSLHVRPGVAALAAMLAFTTFAHASPQPSKAPPSDCGAAALEGSIGKPVTGTTAEDVKIGDEPVLSKGQVRVIAPGDMVTQDFVEERLNLEIDAAGNLTRARCG
ncbi:I78 family peptidase inhibitor [Paradevosia shaoguanensis]|uniref:I78 family peptidase inhibitor n=1 Tax=Paradevosia shaoguanensis TaxID=1335043 RepID=UPI001931A165|nr:I78 family peptidase inhibitor [Paradevosia shaoguanensis]